MTRHLTDDPKFRDDLNKEMDAINEMIWCQYSELRDQSGMGTDAFDAKVRAIIERSQTRRVEFATDWEAVAFALVHF